MVFWPFRRKGLDYEHELPRLSEQIVSAKTYFLKAQSAHRRWPFLFLLQSAAIYVLYVAVYFSGVLQGTIHKVLLIFVPIAIILVRKGISRLTKWRMDRAKLNLESMVEKRKKLVDEYKEKMNFDKIQKLIEDPMSVAPEDLSSSSQGDGQKQSTKNGAKRPVNDRRDPNLVSKMPVGTVPESIPIYKTSWVDRVLDLAVGEDEQSPNSRYALICFSCGAHNGLAPYGKLAEEIAYDCPVCAHHNGPDFIKGEPDIVDSDVEAKVTGDEKMESDTDTCSESKEKTTDPKPVEKSNENDQTNESSAV
ncbi:hypothetical protein DASB73_015600 [Starmerella bacillaris]|uniref:Endoplasmic reticulum junction formation protein lunapark n=1 Tax=Starmerella bacillaris TaxID=1247836 RepID=A0AAV5RHX0_STABA|nr:hypothetical protein DASB73_015600 [Starmerella bacillaris]